MSHNTNRVGRRRRVLNEEVLSASNIATRSANAALDMEPGDTPRYGAGANIENHPQVTSFVPRRLRTLVCIGFLGIGVCVAGELTAHYAVWLSETTQVLTTSEIIDVFANRFVAWTSATVLLFLAGYARLVYSLRRHRVDDYRGLYRVWRTASWAAILLSLNAVLGGHALLARCLGHWAEWQMLPASAGWWLVPSALFGGWLLARLIVDASECRTALAMYLLAFACLTVAGVHSAGWSPAWAADWPGVLGRSLPLLGYTFLLVATLSFARYVVLDVQGLIERTASNPTTHVGKPNPKQDAHIELAADTVETSSDVQCDEAEQDIAWVDGSTPEPNYDEEFDRPLSKAERKRLRKQKQRYAA